MPLTEQEELELLELERERAGIAATEVGGLTPGGKIKGGKLSATDRLNIVKSQLADPHRNMAFDSELQAEIVKLSKEAAQESSQNGADQSQIGNSAPRASQADVRASEPAMTPMQTQREKEAAFERAEQERIQATGGVLKPGQSTRQATTEFSSQRDPAETREQAAADEVAETGELSYEDTIGYQVAKPAAAIAGFAGAGPAGATAAEALVRYALIANNLDAAVKSGNLSEDDAAEIMAKEMMKGSATDAAFNFGVPLLGKLVAKVPGAKWLGNKVGALLQKVGVPAGAAKPTERELKLKARAALTENPARQAAVRELGARTKEIVPTPGQVRGDVNLSETVAHKAFPRVFEKQEAQLTEAAEGMRREAMYPAGQPTAKALGERITKAADDVVAAVKKRLRPTFEAADNLGVKVDLGSVADRARKALDANAKIPGGKLAEKEVAQLQALVDSIPPPNVLVNGTRVPNPTMGAEETLDFISRQKELLRSTTADYKPSKFYETIVNDLVKEAETAYATAAAGAGKADVVKNLMAARNDYKEMMSTVYDDAVKTALKKNPEDVGRLFWQGGNVSEIEQLQKLLQIAQREKTMGKAYADKLSRDVTRGFLQEAVRDLNSAATWSSTLSKDPLKKRTWETLTAGPNGAQLRNAMEVLEHAAQIATKTSGSGTQILPVGRAVAGGLGISYVTGVINPGVAIAGLGVVGMARALATAYTQGNKGAINLISSVLRASGAGTPAAAKTLQETLLPQLEKFAAENDIEDLFVPADQEQK